MTSVVDCLGTILTKEESPLAHTQIACNESFIALPSSSNEVGIWKIDDVEKSPKCLRGHAKRITALAFGNGTNPCLLCSGSEDSIFVWHTEKAIYDYNTGSMISGTKVAKDLGKIQNISFSGNDIYICACVGDEVWVLDIVAFKHVATLEGHTSLVTGAIFCPHDASKVVTIGEDRTFKIWNLENSTVVFKSSIISAFPFLSIAMHPDFQHFAIGSTDGKIRVYDLSTHRILHDLDIQRILKRTIKESNTLPKSNDPCQLISTDRIVKYGNSELDPLSCEQESDLGFSVLALKYWKDPRLTAVSLPRLRDQETFFVAPKGNVRESLQDPSVLVVGCTSAIVLLDASSFDILLNFDLSAPSIRKGVGTWHWQLSTAGSFAFSKGENKAEINALIAGIFQNVVHVIRISPSCSDKRVSSASPSSEDSSVTVEIERNLAELTVVPSIPVKEDSILRSDFVAKAPVRQAKGKDSGRKKDKMNQPLVFHTKIQSSGYTATPRRKMFAPQTNASGNKAANAKSMNNNKVKGPRVFDIEYPMQSEPPIQPRSKHTVPARPTVINDLRFSDDGKFLACALGDSSAVVIKAPFMERINTYAGHNGIINSAQVSHNSKFLVTASSDKSCKIWGNGTCEAFLTLSNVQHNITSEKVTPAEEKENPRFARDINRAQFFYVDQFLLLSSGDSLFLYKYNVDLSKNDLKRYQTQNRYKLVSQFAVDDVQYITTFSAVNSFYSYIVLCACSNKSLVVFDMNNGKVVRVMEEVHLRNIHSIYQNEGSQFACHPPDGYDLFLTAAATDGVKLWDLRMNSCVRRYDGHQNRVHSTGVALSPCGRFIATGSEDRAAYVYDIRSSQYLHRLPGHSDVVSCVSFHPQYPMLATASLDGQVRFFQDSP